MSLPATSAIRHDDVRTKASYRHRSHFLCSLDSAISLNIASHWPTQHYSPDDTYIIYCLIPTKYLDFKHARNMGYETVTMPSYHHRHSL